MEGMESGWRTSGNFGQVLVNLVPKYWDSQLTNRSYVNVTISH